MVLIPIGVLALELPIGVLIILNSLSAVEDGIKILERMGS